MSEYEQDYDRECPHCNHSPLHYRDCAELMCEHGAIDVSDEDYLEPGSSYEVCSECKGTGVEWWCPKCGENLSGHDFDDNDDDEEYFIQQMKTPSQL